MSTWEFLLCDVIVLSKGASGGGDDGEGHD